MYKYILLFGSKISSLFNYILEKFTLKRKKYKRDDNDDDNIIYYDNIYENDDTENVIFASLIDV
jgi:hypothetical protein